MSFDIYLHWFRDGQPDRVPLQQLREAFGEMLVAEDAFGWRLDGGDIYLHEREDDPQAVSGFSVKRPSRAPELWEALYALLKLKHGAFFFPGGGLWIARRDTAAHLPADMLATLGAPVVAHGGLELRTAVESD